MPRHYNVKYLILVAHHIPDKDDIVFQQFEKISVKDFITDPPTRKNGIKIILYEKGIAQKKAEFTR